MLLITFFLGAKLIEKKLKLKTLIKGIITFIIFFVIYAIVLNKGGSLEFTLVENIYGVTISLLRYCISPIAAFDIFLQSQGV